jgi:hypothetical protein
MLRSSAGATTKTTHDDSNSDSSSREMNSLRRKMKRLELNSIDETTSIGKLLSSPQS